VPSQPISLLLAIEHPFLRGTIARWLETIPNIRIVGEADNLPDAVTGVAKHQPQLLLISTQLQEQPTFAACKELQESSPKTKALFLCHKTQDSDIAQALAAGSQWCISTTDTLEDAAAVIMGALANVAQHTPTIRERLVAAKAGGINLKRPTRMQTLSCRQCEVLRYVATGLSKREVAEKMYISPRTVERHVANIMAALNIHDRVHLTRFAIREGMVEA